MTRPSEIARLWLEAITTRNKVALFSISHAAIEIHGPQGIGSGHQILSDWFESEPMRISIKALAERGSELLVHHHIDWFGENGQIEYSIDNAALIEIRADKVFSYRRVEDSGAQTSEFTPVTG
jgi:hypothetical protein